MSTTETASAQATPVPVDRSVRIPRLRAGLREFVVIVAGVMAALVAQAWWQGREERGREQAYLRQLLADVRENERTLADAMVYNEGAWKAANRARAVVVGRGTPPPPDSFMVWLGRAGQTRSFRPLYGTYRALVGTGDLRLIRTDSLRTLITQSFARVESESETFRDLEAQEMQQVAPFVHTESYLQREGPSRRVDYAGLRADPQVTEMLSVVRVLHANELESLREMQRATARLRRALEVELGIADSARA